MIALSRRCRHISLLATVLLGSSLGQAAPVQLFEDNWYEVELLMVAYTNEQSIDQEHWPKVLPVDTVEQSIKEPEPVDLSTRLYHMQQFERQWYKRLPLVHPSPSGLTNPIGAINDRLLQREANRISPQAGIEVVWHQRWIEQIQPEQAAIPHPIHLTLPGEPEIDIDGYISIYLSRYLHLRTDLIVQHLSATAPEDPVIIEVPAADWQSGDQMEQTKQLIEAGKSATIKSPLQIPTAAPLPDKQTSAPLSSPDQSSPVQDFLTLQPTLQRALTFDGLYPVRAGRVQLQRRMRSGELHYVDHPMLGVIVRLTPVEPAPVEPATGH